MTAEEVYEAARLDALLYGVVFIRMQAKDGELQCERVSPYDPPPDPDAKPRPLSDRMNVGE